MKGKIFLFCLFCFISTAVMAANPSQKNASADGKKIVNYVKDTAITAQVMAKIAMDKTVAHLEVDVTTQDGTVILKGKVNSDIEANKLIKLATSTSGVKNIDASKLIIKKSVVKK